ncbi:MAG: hypothetical protein JWQ70_1314 [Aeromicrobium sp.]|nr:hypothetical protein [Aeromicrobium sp.]
MRGVGVAAALISLVALAACSPSHASPHREVAPAPGQCIAKEKADLDDFAPDFTSVVPCTKPHAYEIVDVQPIPHRFLSGTTPKQRLANRAELTKASGEGQLPRDFRVYSLERCRLAIIHAAGLDRVKIKDKSAAETRIYPVLGGAEMRLNVASPKRWVAGDRDFECSVRYTAHQNARSNRPIRLVTSKGLPDYRMLTTGDFPADRRQCVTYDQDDNRVLVPCSKQHYGEVMFRYDAAKVFSTSFIAGLRKREYYNEDYTDKQWETLSGPCFDALDTLFGADWSEKLTGSADFGDIGWEADLNTGRYDFNCLATPYESETYDLPPGSLFNGASDVHLVKIGKKLPS